ncbi:ABC transporter ATP-binding protein [Rhodanobacter sp. C01]|uniref:ABC transporter ATP-binding protein n=1 Tax=Rhodanobacter sp. C01 TaxID=1945856 RepID=UPI0009877586|nr:ABC transporter ATP-binding protein [Rhodanobacter sp. C01]OOG48539.1 ABC transporter ATP-binding protein [Rhodanobacter sp. C01]
MNDIAIQVSNLSKCFQIYDKPSDRLKQYVVPKLYRPLHRVSKAFPAINVSTPMFYREFWALRDTSFEVRKGETVGILGRNGSGKSTLLQLICGTLQATSGTVETHGRIAALLELGSGFNPEFTGRENVHMNGAILGLSEDEINARFDDIAAFADIGQFMEQPVKTYSSGMYLRLAFAVNILSTPQIMVVDEALAVGDMAFQAKCMTALSRLQDSGTTVLFVSHDLGALKGLCSRGIYLEHGAIVEIGPASEVAEHYNRRMREEMNAACASASSSASTEMAVAASAGEPALGSMVEFKAGKEFESRVSCFRYGDGGAKIRFAELLDEDGNPIDEVGFNQAIQIRIHFEASTNENLVSVNYYVLDDKKIYILGADVALADADVLNIRSGDRYIVTYKTRLPLHEGNFSIQLEITSPLIKDQSARFLDVIDDAIVFRMLRREGSRLWAKAFVDNEVDIKCLPHGR